MVALGYHQAAHTATLHLGQRIEGIVVRQDGDVARSSLMTSPTVWLCHSARGIRDMAPVDPPIQAAAGSAPGNAPMVAVHKVLDPVVQIERRWHDDRVWVHESTHRLAFKHCRTKTCWYPLWAAVLRNNPIIAVQIPPSQFRRRIAPSPNRSATRRTSGRRSRPIEWPAAGYRLCSRGSSEVPGRRRAGKRGSG